MYIHLLTYCQHASDPCVECKSMLFHDTFWDHYMYTRVINMHLAWKLHKFGENDTYVGMDKASIAWDYIQLSFFLYQYIFIIE